MIPNKSDDVDMSLSDLSSGLKSTYGEERPLRHSGMVRRTRPQMCNCTSGNLEIPGSFRFATRPGMTKDLSDIGEPRRALVDIGAQRLSLIGAAHQSHLLDGFGKQRRAGIDGKIIQQTLGGADRVRTLAGDLPRDLQGCGARVVADPRRKPITQGFLRRENPPGIRQL